MTDDMTVEDIRPLTSEERRLLQWLLANGTPKAREFEAQLPEVRVVSHCSCGCPTIDLAVGDREGRKGPSTILADVTGVSPEGVPVDVTLHAREGAISELEVVIKDPTGSITLPRPEDLARWDAEPGGAT